MKRSKNPGQKALRNLEAALGFTPVAPQVKAWLARDVESSPAGGAVPFAGLFERPVAWAIGRLGAKGSVRSRFAPEAMGALARALRWRLVSLSAGTLLTEFDQGRPAGHQALAAFLGGVVRVSGEEGAQVPQGWYRTFVRKMLRSSANGWWDVLRRYPVLAELLDRELGGFNERVMEMAQRLEADLSELCQTLGWENEPGRVAAVELELSDPHHDGRSVAVFVFESGRRIVYKPRGLELDAAFHAFHRVCDPEAPLPRFLLRPDYGWMEYFAAQAPRSRRAGERRARRAGSLLAVLYVLGTTDAHTENVVFRDDEPVLIDAETVLQPHLPFTGDAQGLGYPRPWDSVVRTHLLPRWVFSANGCGARDLGALKATPKILGDFVQPRWRDVNTDWMTLGSEPVRLLRPSGSKAWAEGFAVEKIVEGFEERYRALRARREELLASPAFSALRWTRVRLVLRDTRTYGEILQATLEPGALQSGAKRDRMLRALPRLTKKNSRTWAAIRRAELRALRQLDVPHFWIRADGCALAVGAGKMVRIPKLKPGFADARQRFLALGEFDLQRQLGLIRATYTASEVCLTDAMEKLRPFVQGTSRARPASTKHLLRAAVAIADEISGQALWDEDGGATWLDVYAHAGANCYSVNHTGLDLYRGNAGIAVFLAAAAAASGQSRFADVAMAALQPVRRAIGRQQTLLPMTGAGTGQASLIYALVRCAGWLGAESLTEMAQKVARSIGDGAMSGDREGDVLGGNPGLIVGLLALYRTTGNADLLARAVAAGRAALAYPRALPRLTGFAHGAAGNALAFFRLAQASGEEIFLEAAREAVLFERQSFKPRASNWPDFRLDGKRQRCLTMWCHGAPGIGLSRVAMLELERDHEFEGEIEAAVKATLAYGLRNADHLCCGNFGRLDLLVEAGLRLKRPAWHRMAVTAATELLGERRRQGGWRLANDSAPTRLKPSLFRGSAGVGYELLRMVAPGEFPSVLTWS